MRYVEVVSCFNSRRNPTPYKKIARYLILNRNALAFVSNTTGVGETRPIKMGTPGRVPLENVLSEIPAAPDQDLFAAAVDFCFIVLTPVLRTANDNVWTLPVRGTRGG